MDAPRGPAVAGHGDTAETLQPALVNREAQVDPAAIRPEIRAHRHHALRIAGPHIRGPHAIRRQLKVRRAEGGAFPETRGRQQPRPRQGDDARERDGAHQGAGPFAHRINHDGPRGPGLGPDLGRRHLHPGKTGVEVPGLES